MCIRDTRQWQQSALAVCLSIRVCTSVPVRLPVCLSVFARLCLCGPTFNWLRRGVGVATYASLVSIMQPPPCVATSFTINIVSSSSSSIVIVINLPNVDYTEYNVAVHLTHHIFNFIRQALKLYIDEWTSASLFLMLSFLLVLTYLRTDGQTELTRVAGYIRRRCVLMSLTNPSSNGLD